MDPQVVKTVGSLPARWAGIPRTCCVDCSHMLCKSASIWKSAATAPTGIGFSPRMSELVSTQSLLGFERLSAFRAHVTGDGLRLVDNLVSIEGGSSLERLPAGAAGEGTFGGVNGRVNFQIAAIHERATADFTDVAGRVGRVAA